MNSFAQPERFCAGSSVNWQKLPLSHFQPLNVSKLSPEYWSPIIRPSQRCEPRLKPQESSLRTEIDPECDCVKSTGRIESLEHPAARAPCLEPARLARRDSCRPCRRPREQRHSVNRRGLKRLFALRLVDAVPIRRRRIMAEGLDALGVHVIERADAEAFSSLAARLDCMQCLRPILLAIIA